jgi:hypothetical protein
MRSRVIVVVGVLLLEPSLFVDFAYDVPLDLMCHGVIQHSGYPGVVEDFVSGDVGAVDTRVEGVVEVVVWVATEGTDPVGEAGGHVGFVGNALCLRRRAASAADDLRVARGCRWRSLVVVKNRIHVYGKGLQGPTVSSRNGCRHNGHVIDHRLKHRAIQTA